eukprot:TRINITY_DN1912_c0_g1_i2.p1 TRINITY_DN1912_c0_g1~~TRINITY_DN1912_c0_g1_i2.p1  ORF type:complete len:148 (-),score=39.56 TRINITY_DN1912_c0_g1_i2:37-480(-)
MELDDFYLRYYVGHKGKFGHEFLEFEVRPNGFFRYANGTKYRKDSIIRKRAIVQPLVLSELANMICSSGILEQSSHRWPEPDAIGRQTLEVQFEGRLYSFTTAKIGTILDVRDSEDPHGLEVFYYLVQDLRSFFLSLISMHFKIQPI